MQNREGNTVKLTWRSALLFFGLFAAAAVCGVCAVEFTSNHPPYNHVLTSVERIDEDADALRVFHDKVRGVTCYETYGLCGSLACTPDVWLSPYHNGTSMLTPDASSP